MSSGRTWVSEPLKARPMGVRTASTITASGMCIDSPGGRGRRSWKHSCSLILRGYDHPPGLLRRHPQRAVEADRLTVEHRVLRDVTRKRGELRGPAQARRERDLLAELLACGLRKGG